MGTFLINSALDRRFVDLAFFMCLGVWPWLLLITIGIAAFAWKLVLLCQLIALPFAVIGWAMGFRGGRRLGFGPRGSAMIAGWTGLLTAEVGLALVLLPWLGKGAYAPGYLAFPALAVLVTVGVLLFYRARTWTNEARPLRKNQA
ncbi:MAG: hypothetical protein WCC57_17615 [Paracoccaceae bacterium]